MAVIANATDSASVADVTLTEMIDRMVQFGVRDPRLWTMLANMVMIAQTDTYRPPVVDEFSAASAAATETDENASTELIPTSATITVAEYAKVVSISDTAVELTVFDLVSQAVDNIISSCDLRVESNVLALAASLSNTQGDNATVNTLANLMSAVSAFRAQAKFAMSEPVCVLSTNAQRDLTEDAVSSGASVFGSVIGQAFASMGGPNLGPLQSINGIRYASSGLMPAGDVSGKSNMIIHAAPGEWCLATPWRRGIRVEPQREADRIASKYVGSFVFGAGIVDQNRGYKFITRA